MQNFPEILNRGHFIHQLGGSIPEFITEKHTEWYVTYNYKFLSSELQNSSILRECRGIAFNNDEKGKLISRPFHKFYNINENETVLWENIKDKILFTTTKYDGSMIRPLWFLDSKGNPNFVLSTKSSHDTTVAKLANSYLTQKLKNFIFDLGSQVTPIFEFISPHNQHVLKYKDTNFVLIGIRDNITGHYLNYNKLKYFSEMYNIVIAEQDVSAKHFDYNETNVEGCVVELNDGNKVKLKTKWYFEFSKYVNGALDEKAILKLFIENKLDDLQHVINFMNLNKFVDDTISSYEKFFVKIVTEVRTFVDANKSMKRKDFALLVNQIYGKDKFKKSLMFAEMDNKDLSPIINKYILETNKSVKEL